MWGLGCGLVSQRLKFWRLGSQYGDGEEVETEELSLMQSNYVPGGWGLPLDRVNAGLAR